MEDTRKLITSLTEAFKGPKSRVEKFQRVYKDLEDAMDKMRHMTTANGNLAVAWRPFFSAWIKFSDVCDQEIEDSLTEGSGFGSKLRDSVTEGGSCKACGAPLVGKGDDGKSGLCKDCKEWQGSKTETDQMMEPGFVKTPEDEKLWAKAKAKAGKEGGETNWALANHIYSSLKGESIWTEDKKCSNCGGDVDKGKICPNCGERKVYEAKKRCKNCGKSTKDLRGDNCVKCDSEINLGDKLPGKDHSESQEPKWDEAFWDELNEVRKNDALSEKELHFAGYDFDSDNKGTKVRRKYVDLKKKGDYGADPLGNGKFKMVPSGDVVDKAERDRRLKK